MAIRHVRPTGAHGNTPDGLTYNTAWLGLSTIVWADLTAGSTLNVWGTHQISAQFQPGIHGGAAGNPVTIYMNPSSNDPGIFDVTGAGNVWAGNARPYTVWDGGVFKGNDTQAFYHQPSAKFNTFRNCTFIGRKIAAGSIFNMEHASGTHQGIVFDGCTFTGTARYGLRWLPSDSVTPSQLIDITVQNCTFIDLNTERAALEFRTNANGSVPNSNTWMRGIKVVNSTFKNIYGYCVEISDIATSMGGSSGIEITDNVFQDSYSSTVNMNDQLGGALAICGFAKVNGQYNKIARNYIKNITGLAGGIDIFQGSYLIIDNYIDTIYTLPGKIDGTGIIFDSGSNDVIATRNKIMNIYGDVTANNEGSGSGFTMLQAQNVKVFGNTVSGCRIGISYGNPIIPGLPPITSITFSGTTATLTIPYHGLQTGDLIHVSGAVPSVYAVRKAAITVTSPTTFTYEMASVPATNATTVGKLYPYGRQSSLFSNNTLAGCRFSTVTVGALNDDIDNNTLINNIFLAEPSAYIGFKFINLPWTNEKNNIFFGTSKADPNGRFSPSASSRVTNPLLDNALKPSLSSPAISTGTYVDRFSDASNKPFRLKPTLGAYEVSFAKNIRLREY